jgi:hypothetical protein
MDSAIEKPINKLRRKTMFNKHMSKFAVLGFSVALALALVILHIGLPAVVGAQGPDGGISAQSLVDTAFTYQGRLNDGGSPANGSYDFRFYVCDAQSGGTILSSYEISDLTVTDGYFTVQLDSGSTDFTGEARWLEISVREHGQTSYTTLSPRVPLTAVPYAHSLRPGAKVESTGVALQLYTSATAGSALHANASASGGNPAGVYGVASAPEGAGIAGYNNGSGYGVYGGSDQGYGVYGKSNTFDGIGVYGEGSGLAIYSKGDAHIDGDLTWEPITSYVSVSAAAFRPTSHTDQYLNWGDGLTSDNPSSTNYYASVQLPHGATVTKMTFYWYDDVTANASCGLYRSTLSGAIPDEMAYVESGSGGAGSSLDDGILGAVINNSQYAYYLRWFMGHANIEGYGVVIEYTLAKPY